MKGKHRVVVSTKRLKYEFELRRNLTIIQGDSATGKTTLVDMIRDFVNNPSGTPVEVMCDKKCHVVDVIDRGQRGSRRGSCRKHLQKTLTFHPKLL